MRSRIKLSIITGLAAALLALCMSPALATAPSTPISVSLKLLNLNPAAASSDALIEVVSTRDAPGTTVKMVLPEGVVADPSDWLVDLKAGVPVTYTTLVTWAQSAKSGNLMISVRANRPLDATNSWGDMETVPLHLDPGTGIASEGWKVTQVPVAGLLEPGNAQIISMEPTPRSWDEARAEVAPAILPSADAQKPGETPEPPPAAGVVTITGHWDYQDRSNTLRVVDQQLIELRTAAGGALNPRAFCFTDTGGNFSCPGNHPGTNLRVWVWSWTNLNPGPTRLGVFSGSEVAGGCGNENLDCAYPVQTGEMACPDGATCNIGSWFIFNGAEPWGGAHQMTQDMMRSWKKLLFDPTRHTAALGGPARINYPTNHGPHAHVGNGEVDGIISIRPPWQTAADVVTHEYGHCVMSNIWTSLTPRWPTSDCPSPHFIDGVSGPGCALSEGFADYWSWYSDEFYDGDNTTANDGPVYNDPGFSVDFETRAGFANGDQVEGNIAGIMGDLADGAQDGGAAGTSTAGDHLADGVGHVWHVLSVQSDNNFGEWWNAYWSGTGHDPGLANEILFANSVNYGWIYQDNCVDNQQLFAGTSSVAGSNFAYRDSTDPGVICGNGSQGRSAFYRYVAPSFGTVQIDTFGSTYDTILSSYTGGCGAFAAQLCNDDYAPPQRWSLLQEFLTPNQSLSYMVSAYVNDGGLLQVNTNFYPSPAPFNDSCVNPYVVTSWPLNDYQFTGNGTVEGFDPSPSCGSNSNAASTWYRFTAPSAGGELFINTFGSDYDTILSVYTGACGGLTSAACNDDTGGLQSEIIMGLAGGQTVYIMVSSFNAPFGGNMYFNLDFVPNSGTVPDGYFAPGALLEVSDAGGGLLNLAWGASCQGTDTDYSIYEGQIGAWYSHYGWYCSTSGSTAATIVSSSYDTYYLVVPHNRRVEGGYGYDSAGNPRPQSFFYCYQQRAAGCPPACAQDKCSLGAALNPACNSCVAQICAVDPYCCTFAYDGTCVSEVKSICRSLACGDDAGVCAHAQCEQGVALAAGCDDPPISPSCVSAVCSADPYCCAVFWDSQCVAEVPSYCSYTCN